MKKLQLIINAGSATYKYSLFQGEKKLISALYEKIGKNSYQLKTNNGKGKKSEKITKTIFNNSLSDFLKRRKGREMTDINSIGVMAFRVVHGGSFFKDSTLLSKAVLKKLKKLDELAPLHNPYARKLINEAEKILPRAKKMLIFDTSFHSSIPEQNWRYAIPRKITDRNGIRRYGFHGIVCSSIVFQLKKKKKLSKKMIICHLGSGCSITAVEKGKSINTSMGLTPLGGVMMGTRAGDLDPGVLIQLLKSKKVSLSQMEEILNHQSGLKGLTGEQDMRKIIKNFKKKDAKAVMALDMFCRVTAEYIARYVTNLGGLNHLVFSGGIGENSILVREKICDYLKPLGVRLNSKKNKNANAGKVFQKRFSKVKLSWMHADEASEMNRVLLGKMQ